MVGPWPRSAMAAPWLLLVLAGVVLRVHGQADNLGFISIDCGLPVSASGYVDNATKLSFVSDAGFIDAGTNYNMSAEYITPSMGRSWHTVRSFTGASARNCYTLRSLASGLKYLIRATFMYGNYDGVNRVPVFDLHVGVNYWTTVNISDADTPVMVEVITLIAGDRPAQVCLVNTGSGTPFISGLSLRPLKDSLYPMANTTQGLVLLSRSNLGTSDSKVIRFPDDPHDRFWFPESKPTEWLEIATPLKVQHYDNDNFDVPSAVMQTAVTPINASKPIEYSWDAEPSAKNPAPGYMCILHFSELQVLPAGTARQFYININGILALDNGFTPDYLYSDPVHSTRAFDGFHQYTVSLNATPNSTLPPVLNAIEIFSVLPTTGVPTAAQDVSAITEIRGKYQVKKNWMGDPCVPKSFAWNGLGCSYAVSSPPSVTGLNLSSSGLTGNMSASFASLKGLQYLDLSRNSLTGSIPGILSQLSSLTFLDLTANQLSGSIPSGLLKRMQDGSLTLRFGNNPDLCSNGESCQPQNKKKTSKVALYVVVPIVAVLVIVLLLVLLICILKKKKGRAARNSVRLQNEASIALSRTRGSNGQSSVCLDNRRFTYAELEAFTDGFRREIGRGGFGKVYDGFLEDGTQVAVKLRSESSDQGVQEFLAEVRSSQL
ncbi:hypothetical protein QYE76_015996 [Lolium multiflorum]|uniref:Malectin-like domain-containing protein n=1 Tax=Lolium multiflorum TaxID=4521 RepID=A0AAD8U953_LOLMU|nr:hypothetical protein QYE76_015996 [Lolium multiflorum]